MLGTAYGTYHLYNSNDPITTVACSDGANGLETRWGYTDLSPMFPYVAAWDQISWNSPNCGTCILLNTSTTSIFLTAIDSCGAPPGGYDTHLDIAQPAFVKLFGQAGIDEGHGINSVKFIVIMIVSFIYYFNLLYEFV
jgi:hypothetical protein